MDSQQKRYINQLVENLLPWLDKELYANIKQYEGTRNDAFEEMRRFFEKQAQFPGVGDELGGDSITFEGYQR